MRSVRAVRSRRYIFPPPLTISCGEHGGTATKSGAIGRDCVIHYRWQSIMSGIGIGLQDDLSMWLCLFVVSILIGHLVDAPAQQTE